MQIHHLSRKSHTYYLRIRIPRSLVSIMKSREFKCSLKTTCFHTARQLVQLSTPGIHTLFILIERIHHSMFTEYEKERLIQALQMHKRLEIASTSELMQAGTTEIARLREELDAKLEQHQAIAKALQDDNYDDAQLVGSTSLFLCHAPDRIAYDFSSNNPEAVFLMRVAGRTLLDTYNAKRRILAGLMPDSPASNTPVLVHTTAQPASPIQGTVPITQTISPKKAPSLSQAIPAFLSEKEKQAIHIKNMGSYKLVLERLITYTHDKAVNEITRQDIIGFRDYLTTLPKRKGSDKKLSPTYINGQLRKTEYFFNWCMTEDFGIEKNPSAEVAFRNAKTKRRLPFTTEDIQLLFSGAIFTGQGKVNKCAYYWIPLIGLHTGARVEEISQLTLDDIKVIDAIHCFQFRQGAIITPDGTKHEKSLKNQPSERDVPIHSKLIALGFLDYVKQVNPGKGNQLFPSLVRNKTNGFSHAIVKFFGTYKTGFGMDEDKVFHSFRHTMINNLKQLGVPEIAIKDIVGHEQEGTTMTVYARSFQMQKLQEYLEHFQPVIDAKPFVEQRIARPETQHLRRTGK